MDSKKLTLIAWDPPGYGYSRAQERNYVKTVYQDDAHLAAAMMEVNEMKSNQFELKRISTWISNYISQT